MPTNVIVRDMSFLDQETGYVGGGSFASGTSNALMFTEDGGGSWSQIDWANQPDRILSSLHFYSVDNGYLSSGRSSPNSALVYYTTDGGENWTEAAGGDAFSNDVGGLAVQGNNLLFSSSDRGMSWSSEAVSGVTRLNDVSRQGSTTWIAGSSSGAYVARRVNGAWVEDWNEPGVHPVVEFEMFSATRGVAMGELYIAHRTE